MASVPIGTSRHLLEIHMTRFAEVRHPQRIAAPVAAVRAQFADLDHHIRRNVHPKLRFEVLERRARGARFVQEVKLLGIRQRDVFERSIEADGSIEDRSVEGFNRGGTLRFHFQPQTIEGRAGTLVEIVVRLPLPPVIGVLVKPLLVAQIRKEVRAAALEDRDDIEQRGYRSSSGRLGPCGLSADLRRTLSSPATSDAVSSRHFDLVSHRRIDAPVEHVWAALTDRTLPTIIVRTTSRARPCIGGSSPSGRCTRGRGKNRSSRARAVPAPPWPDRLSAGRPRRGIRGRPCVSDRSAALWRIA
jgi:hypothetical protein